MTCLRSRLLLLLLCVALLVSLPVLAGDVASAPQAREEFHVGPSVAVLSIADIHNSAAKLSSLNAVGPLTVEERARLTRKDASDLRARVGIVRDLGPGVMLDLAATDIPRDLPAAVAGGLLEQRSDDYVWTAGSSGSPVFRYSPATGAQVVGNLSGSNAATQQDLESYCNDDKYIVRDGAFFAGPSANRAVARWKWRPRATSAVRRVTDADRSFRRRGPRTVC